MRASNHLIGLLNFLTFPPLNPNPRRRRNLAEHQSNYHRLHNFSTMAFDRHRNLHPRRLTRRIRGRVLPEHFPNVPLFVGHVLDNMHIAYDLRGDG